jgi:hypothetical protein
MIASTTPALNVLPLPLEIINRIVLLSAIQQDKMYIPTFNLKGRCSWKFNRNADKIQKIENVYKRRLANPVQYGTFILDDEEYVSETILLTDSDIEENKVEYIHFKGGEGRLQIDYFVMLKWTTIYVEGYLVPYLVSGNIYAMRDKGCIEFTPPNRFGYNNGHVFQNRIYREIYTDYVWQFYSLPYNMGEYIYNPELEMYEFTVSEHFKDPHEEEEEDIEIVYGNSGDLPEDWMD